MYASIAGSANRLFIALIEYPGETPFSWLTQDGTEKGQVRSGLAPDDYFYNSFRWAKQVLDKHYKTRKMQYEGYKNIYKIEKK